MSDSIGIIPATTVAPATDEVIDAIADIEMKRQTTEKEAGFAMSRSSALHRLNELLEHETEALRLRGTDSVHHANVQAVRIEMGKLKELTASRPLPPRFQGSPVKYTRTEQRSFRDAQRTAVRNRGRRTMGRGGGRG